MSVGAGVTYWLLKESLDETDSSQIAHSILLLLLPFPCPMQFDTPSPILSSTDVICQPLRRVKNSPMATSNYFWLATPNPEEEDRVLRSVLSLLASAPNYCRQRESFIISESFMLSESTRSCGGFIEHKSHSMNDGLQPRIRPPHPVTHL